MSAPGLPTQPFRIAFCAAALLLAAACSLPRVAYNNADMLARHMAGDYFDLTPEQSDQFRERFARLHQWHRASELPAYAGFMREAGLRVGKGLRSEDVAWAMNEGRARYRLLVAAAAREAAPLLAGLSPAQLDHLEKTFAEKNAKYAREMLPKDEKRRGRAYTKRLHTHFKDWLGELSDAQEARIEAFARAHTRYVALRFEERQRWQREALALLRQRLPAEELVKRVPDFLAAPGKWRSPEYLAEEKRWQEDFTRLLLELDQSLTSEQRAYAVRRMNGYAEDFMVLAGGAGRRA